MGFMTSCVSIDSPNKDLPMYESFRSIYKERYISNKNDCSNKCAKYLDALKKNGYDGEIVVVHTGRTLHSVVKTGNIYVDPTWGTYSKSLKRFGSYHGTIKYEDMHKWSEFKINR